MPTHVRVRLGDRSYSIEVGAGVLPSFGARCRKLKLGASCLVVSDATVFSLYGRAVCDSLVKSGFRVSSAVVPAGEASKSSQMLSSLYTAALVGGLDRKSFIVALGGGVVGDLAGYLAATYLRGIPYVQVPTTLLAMVDSSVGGKTGINLPQGKNLVGAFHQPAFVLADLDTLATLPARELRAGLAEVVKYGVIRDAALFRRLEVQAAGLVAGDARLLGPMVARCCEIKADVVARDEREGGLRAILNFGHTLGHAVEQATGYRRYLHGEAVSLGMVFAARVSVRAAGLKPGDAARLEALLAALGLPVRQPRLAWQRIRGAMAVDKKSAGGLPRWVLARGIGRVQWGCEVPEAVLRGIWQRG